MSDKWTNFLLAVVTVIAIPIIVKLVFQDPMGFEDDYTTIRYYTYFLYIILSITLTVRIYVRQKRYAPWENRDENIFLGIFASFMLYAVMVSYSAPGLETVTNHDGEVIGYVWVDDVGMQGYLYIVIFFMIIYVYALYWELDKLKPQK